MDYADLKKLMDEVIHEFDHDCLNELPRFRSVNPTSENLAEYIYEKFDKRLPPSVRLESVKIAETDNFSVTYRK